MMSSELCELCGEPLVQAAGGQADHPKYHGILVVGEKPDWEDVMSGVAYTQGTDRKRFSHGDVLAEEFNRAGLSWPFVRRTYLFGHPMANANQAHRELDYHLTRLMKEVYKSQFVLLMGAEVVRTFTGQSVSSVYGLPVTAQQIPDSIRVYACPAPGIALSPQGTIGELRYSIERFVEVINGD